MKLFARKPHHQAENVHELQEPKLCIQAVTMQLTGDQPLPEYGDHLLIQLSARVSAVTLSDADSAGLHAYEAVHVRIVSIDGWTDLTEAGRQYQPRADRLHS